MIVPPQEEFDPERPLFELIYGDDVLRADGARAGLFGGTGRDRLFGGQFGDVLMGGQARDVLFGYGGDDYLLGHAGGSDKCRSPRSGAAHSCER